ncbi:class I SAM-dependent methyltransferase [Salinimicrobium gaetbulicola]|uniref:Class I SAM-dependent methyltransferase n=1 Tax=Salinimicrobium gaetbulicola TaxID=999702 RepID=A0ABW3IKV5_9FLAO
MKPEERIAINKRQEEFYNRKNKNLPTRIWSYFRNGLLNRIKKGIGIEKDIYELHKSWFGDLSDKKVLDLGCYMGNSLSIYLAENSKSYLGIDLSGKGIAHLNRRLEKVKGARAEVMDFLSDDFTEKDFDLIYAYGVLHHFKDVDELIIRLQEKLRPGGIIVSHDPLQTSTPLRILRTVYRPFQSDKDWEWPFSRKTYYKFEKAFEIQERRGVLAKTKYAALLGLVPITEEKKLSKAKAWHQMDWEQSAISDSYMFKCMHLSMLMRNKTT